MRLKSGPVLEIIFDEKVIITERNSIRFEIMNLSPGCTVAWNHSINELNNFNKNDINILSGTFPAIITRKIITQVGLTCSLKGNEIYVVTFMASKNPITDLAKNKISSQVLTLNAMRYRYLSDADKQIIESSGNAFTASSFVTFGLSIGIIMFQSIAISSFWIFVDLVQLLSYIPLLKCEIPENMRQFFSNYLTIGQISIPWNVMPGFVPRIKSYIFNFMTKPFNNDWKLAGFESISFIYNFSDQLTTWIFLFSFYLVLRILTSIVPKSK